MLGFGQTSKLDDSALVKLFDEHAPKLVHAVALLIHDKYEAEEIVQEAFVRLMTSGRRLRNLERAPAFLRSVAFNLARNQIRHRDVVRRKTPLLIDPLEGDQTRSTPELFVLDNLDASALADALHQLSERQRECLVLRYYMDLNEAEIADVLGISKGSVKTHTSRGVEALAVKMGSEK